MAGLFCSKMDSLFRRGISGVLVKQKTDNIGKL
jgi:hypothetical protein